MLSEQELRLIALESAMEIEGQKATTLEVLDAAQSILDFLKGVHPERPARTN
jgi:hypothetical protein